MSSMDEIYIAKWRKFLKDNFIRITSRLTISPRLIILLYSNEIITEEDMEILEKTILTAQKEQKMLQMWGNMPEKIQTLIDILKRDDFLLKPVATILEEFLNKTPQPQQARAQELCLAPSSCPGNSEEQTMAAETSGMITSDAISPVGTNTTDGAVSVSKTPRFQTTRPLDPQVPANEAVVSSNLIQAEEVYQDGEAGGPSAGIMTENLEAGNDIIVNTIKENKTSYVTINNYFAAGTSILSVPMSSSHAPMIEVEEMIHDQSETSTSSLLQRTGGNGEDSEAGTDARHLKRAQHFVDGAHASIAWIQEPLQGFQLILTDKRYRKKYSNKIETRDWKKSGRIAQPRLSNPTDTDTSTGYVSVNFEGDLTKSVFFKIQDIPYPLKDICFTNFKYKKQRLASVKENLQNLLKPPTQRDFLLLPTESLRIVFRDRINCKLNKSVKHLLKLFFGDCSQSVIEATQKISAANSSFKIDCGGKCLLYSKGRRLALCRNLLEPGSTQILQALAPEIDSLACSGFNLDIDLNVLKNITTLELNTITLPPILNSSEVSVSPGESGYTRAFLQTLTSLKILELRGCAIYFDLNELKENIAENLTQIFVSHDTLTFPESSDILMNILSNFGRPEKRKLGIQSCKVSGESLSAFQMKKGKKYVVTIGDNGNLLCYETGDE